MEELSSEDHLCIFAALHSLLALTVTPQMVFDVLLYLVKCVQINPSTSSLLMNTDLFASVFELIVNPTRIGTRSQVLAEETSNLLAHMMGNSSATDAARLASMIFGMMALFPDSDRLISELCWGIWRAVGGKQEQEQRKAAEYLVTRLDDLSVLVQHLGGKNDANTMYIMDILRVMLLHMTNSVELPTNILLWVSRVISNPEHWFLPILTSTIAQILVKTSPASLIRLGKQQIVQLVETAAVEGDWQTFRSAMVILREFIGSVGFEESAPEDDLSCKVVELLLLGMEKSVLSKDSILACIILEALDYLLNEGESQALTEFQ